jgi:hypothetical protein
MTVLPAQLRRERAAEQVVLNRPANLNPRPSPCHRTTSSHEGNPASPDQPQGRTRTRRCPGRLTPDSGHESHPAEVPVSTSGADSSAGAPARPRLSAAELLAAKHTRPIQSPGDLAADIFESDEELEEYLAFTHAGRHRDLA